MADKCRCKNCCKYFVPRIQNPNQKYCSAPACQKARKRNWQAQKLKTDLDYRDNQKEAQRRWRKNNSNYWRKYRKRNKMYTERNRLQQKERNSRRKHFQNNSTSIAKMDASNTDSIIIPGRYELRCVGAKNVAKMDVSIVEINVVSGGY